MEIPRHWRLKKQRYALVGQVCPNCNSKLFPPRDACPACRRSAQTAGLLGDLEDIPQFAPFTQGNAVPVV